MPYRNPFLTGASPPTVGSQPPSYRTSASGGGVSGNPFTGRSYGVRLKPQPSSGEPERKSPWIKPEAPPQFSVSGTLAGVLSWEDVSKILERRNGIAADQVRVRIKEARSYGGEPHPSPWIKPARPLAPITDDDITRYLTREELERLGRRADRRDFGRWG